MSLALRALIFTVVVPGAGGVYAPWWILTHGGDASSNPVWPAIALVVAGVGLYAWCLRVFAVVGRGTPATWDAPRRVVTAGPYGWVRNPIYLAALLIVVGEAVLFLSPTLLVYAIALGLGFQLLVLGYEEPTLGRRFGAEYDAYRQHVPRWIPRRPSPRVRSDGPSTEGGSPSLPG